MEKEEAQQKSCIFTKHYSSPINKNAFFMRKITASKYSSLSLIAFQKKCYYYQSAYAGC